MTYCTYENRPYKINENSKIRIWLRKYTQKVTQNMGRIILQAPGDHSEVPVEL